MMLILNRGVKKSYNKKIDNYNAKVDHLQNILFDNDIKFNDSQKTKDAKKEISEKTQHSLEAAMLSAEKYYEILDHLREYDNNSTTVFNSISELKKISHQGQIGITGGYNSKEKKYSLPKNNKEWQKLVSNNVSNEIADDIEENENYADTTLYKYLKTDYLDKTSEGFAIIGSLFKAHGYILNKSSKQPIKSDYQDRLLNDIKAQGNKSSKVGSVLTKEAKNLEALNSILLPINYIAQIESGATPGEAITDISKDIIISETSKLAVLGIAVASSAEIPEILIIGGTFIVAGILESVSNYLYKHSDTYRKGYDGVTKTIDKGHKKYKDSKKINDYTRRKTDEIIDEYNVDTSQLPNANNQATYYDKYGGGQ